MAIYWTLKSIPELANLTARERRQRWRRISVRAYRHWQTWVAMVICVVITFSGSMVGYKYGHPTVGVIVGGLVGGFVQAQAQVSVVLRFYKDVMLKSE